jgi:hypothetical protein
LNAPVSTIVSADGEGAAAAPGRPDLPVWTRWAIAFLIGLATVTAATFTWRAAQIGSTAAYDDRQSISETVRSEQGNVQRTITIAAAAREYVRYRADYGVAAALDREAARLTAAGADRLAEVSRTEAAALREGATRRAAEAGVFGRSTIGTDLLKPTASPRPFDIDARRRALEAEQSTALDSPGKLDPNGFARQADDIRDRVNGLVRFAFVIAFAVLLYTLAEVSTRRRPTVAFAVAGIAVYAAAVVGCLSTYFFA